MATEETEQLTPCEADILTETLRIKESRWKKTRAAILFVDKLGPALIQDGEPYRESNWEEHYASLHGKLVAALESAMAYIDGYFASRSLETRLEEGG